MRFTRQILPVLLLVLGLYSLTGCGGGTASSLAHSLNQPGSSIDGVTSGSFKAVRYNDHGYQDSALNPTLSLTTTDNGATTTVTIAVKDQNPMIGACVDLFYDPAKFSPVNAEFSGLVTTPLELASTKTTGVVNVGQADVNGAAVRNGQFAVVTFNHGPARSVSAAGDAHTTPINYVYPKTPKTGVTVTEPGFEIVSASADAADATYHMYSTWATGDGDMNGTTNLADLTAMVFNGYFGSTKDLSDAANLGCAATDYDGNCETNIADLTALGQHLNQATTGIDVFIADNDGALPTDPHHFTGTETVLHHFLWSDGTAPVRPPATNIADLDSVYVSWDTGTVTKLQIQTADANGDGIVYLSARATGTGAPGPLFDDATQKVTYTPGPPPPPPGVVVTGYDVQIQHTGADINFSGAGGDASLVAGDTAVKVNVTGVEGTYNDGTNGDKPFTGTTGQSGTGGEISAANYALTLTSVQASTNWSVTTQGNNATNEYHTATPVLTLSGTSGTGLTGSVTVDDDPDSTLATIPEGRLRATVTANAPSIPADITYDIRLDVTQDPGAPVFQTLTSNAAAVGNYLGINAVGTTQINGTIALGTVALPADRTTISAKLVDLTAPGADTTLHYLASGQLSSGQFRIDELVSPMNFICQISGAATPGHLYGIHLILPNGAATTTSSVNYPNTGTLTNELFFKVGPPPAPVTFTTLPQGTDISPVNDTLLIMYPDPVMRRDPRMTFLGGQATATDDTAFNDIIKLSGSEFAPTQLQVTGQGQVTFPKVIGIQGTDASTITSTTQADPLVNASYWSPAGIVVDLAGITSGGTSNVDYAFKVFSGAADPANWTSLGTGTFTYNPTGIASNGYTGVDFGLNIYSAGGNRGSLGLAAADFSDKDLSGDNAKTAVPDVLFVKLSGYKNYDFDNSDPLDAAAPYSVNNTILRLTDDTTSAQIDCPLVPRCIDATGNVIATFVPVKETFSKAGTTGWPGILTPGASYFVTLVDQQAAASDFKFATELTVSGNNPNF